jgi:hypothetical protein
MMSEYKGPKIFKTPEMEALKAIQGEQDLGFRDLISAGLEVHLILAKKGFDKGVDGVRSLIGLGYFTVTTRCLPGLNRFRNFSNDHHTPLGGEEKDKVA